MQILSFYKFLFHWDFIPFTFPFSKQVLIFGWKTENQCEKVENNSNVSVFPSNPNRDNFYPLSFDLMPPLWASYAICARVVDVGEDMIISDG